RGRSAGRALLVRGRTLSDVRRWADSGAVLLRPRDRDRREDQRQLVLDLVRGRLLLAVRGALGGAPVPLRAARAQAAVPALQERARNNRSGLHDLRPGALLADQGRAGPAEAEAAPRGALAGLASGRSKNRSNKRFADATLNGLPGSRAKKGR